LDIPEAGVDVVSRRFSEEILPRKSDKISHFKTPGNEVHTSPELKSPRNKRHKSGKQQELLVHEKNELKSGSPKPRRSSRRSQKSTETSPRVQKNKAEV